VSARLDTRGPVDLAAMLASFGPMRLAAALSLLQPELLVPARLGLEVAHLRAGSVLDEDYCGGRYHRHNTLLELSDLQKRRYPPTGNRELWILYGPAGPPWLAEREAA
jgi:hypothetical protein